MKLCDTRYEQALACEAAGLGPAASELVCAATASWRHEQRMRAATEAALSAAGGSMPLAWAVLAADTIGVGGVGDCEGCATERIPALSACGKGRKHAADGGAWSAAITDVVASHGAWQFTATDGGALAIIDGDDLTRVPLEVVPARWQRAVAARGLLRSLRLSSEPFETSGLWNTETPAEEWGKLFESLEKELNQ